MSVDIPDVVVAAPNIDMSRARTKIGGVFVSRWSSIDIRRATAMSGASSHEVVPPRISLTFKRLSAKGKVVQTASRTLQDNALQLKGRRYENDPLRYEKALVDDWVTKEFGAVAAAR